MTATRVAVLGATSFVGEFLLADLVAEKNQVVAFSRKPIKSFSSTVKWVHISDISSTPILREPIPLWISLIPIWLLPQFFPLLLQLNVERLVVLSSTSRFTKKDSKYADERALAQGLANAEEQVSAWGNKNQVQVVLLQPTMIYAAGRDKNISAIANFIQKFGFFPLFGAAQGLRQPVHGQDVAFACRAALTNVNLKSSYILTGGETLSYREMVQRIFLSLGRPVRIIYLPLWLFKIGTFVAKCFGKKITLGIAERMNQDLAFDHSEATQDLGFNPRIFLLSEFDTSVKK